MIIFIKNFRRFLMIHSIKFTLTVIKFEHEYYMQLVLFKNVKVTRGNSPGFKEI